MVENLNQTVYENSLSSRYTTLCLMRFDTEARILTTVNAGHCPLVLVRANGQLIQIGSDGPPVGLLPSLSFTEQRHALCSGDLLVCHSDGLSECHNNAQEIWPEEQFLDTLRGLYGLSTTGAAEQLMAAADAFADGATQHDDMTVVCLRVC
jgi:serine phosphatase RsbU (regulator of sigma subunit)